MSRTHKDRGFQWRNVKNKLYKSRLHLWSEDFGHRKKNRLISRRLRRRLERDETRELDT